MSLTYDPLWEILDYYKLPKLKFADMVGISYATLAKLGKNESVTLTIIDKICDTFGCKIEDVVQHVPNSTFNQAPFPIEKGTIVTTSDTSSQKIVTDSKGQERVVLDNFPFVVVDILITQIDFDPEIAKDLDEDRYYIITPIHLNDTSSNPEVEIPFSNVEINGKLASGYFSVIEENHSILSSGVFSRCLGKMPKMYMDEYDDLTMNLYC